MRVQLRLWVWRHVNDAVQVFQVPPSYCADLVVARKSNLLHLRWKGGCCQNLTGLRKSWQVLQGIMYANDVSTLKGPL